MILNREDLELLCECPKDFLEKKKVLLRLNECDLERINKYRTCAYSTAAKPSSGGGFTVGNSVSKTEICIVKMDEIGQHIKERSAEIQAHDIKVLFVLDNFVADPINDRIMLMRFVELLSWRDIGDATGLSKRALLKRQEKILKEISEKACTFTSKRDII